MTSQGQTPPVLLAGPRKGVRGKHWELISWHGRVKLRLSADVKPARERAAETARQAVLNVFRFGLRCYKIRLAGPAFPHCVQETRPHSGCVLRLPASREQRNPDNTLFSPAVARFVPRRSHTETNVFADINRAALHISLLPHLVLFD